MRIALFCHSLLSDWNHGNAHFLRGVASELVRRGHEVRAFEPVSAWSVQNLLQEQGARPLYAMTRTYPLLSPERYDPNDFDYEQALDGVDAVLVHEWNDHALVARLGHMRNEGAPFVLLFHDTHHRCVTDPSAMAEYDLSAYDGILAFGRVLRDIYLERSLAARCFVWHEAADIEVFRPPHPAGPPPSRDVVFVGNWGDDERQAELSEYFFNPVAELSLKTSVFGVRYPPHALATLEHLGIDYQGWLPNFEVPRAYGEHRMTVHVPRGPYVRALPGIPTIRVFEALACGIPLACSPWDDAERLFTENEDYLVARSGKDMKDCLAMLSADRDFAARLAEHGRRTILARHTCTHRVDELLGILAELGARGAREAEQNRRAS